MEQGRMNITEYEKDGMRFFATRTGAKDVVTIRGSVLGGSAMLPHELLVVPGVASGILDAGTKKHSKQAIHEALGKRGASINFFAGSNRTGFSATCLPEDVEFVLSLIAECLAEAIFPAHEFAMEKKRTSATIQELKTNTRTLASQELSRLLYDTKHINYSETIPVTEKLLEKTAKKDLAQYQKLLGKGGLVLAIAGDIKADTVLTKAARIFSKLPAGTASMPLKKRNEKAATKTESRIPVKDKANVDVFMGAQVPLTYDDPQFIPFTMLTSMLGGRGLSGGHLMRTIRERDGLTYGIYAMANGFDGLADGSLEIWATFSPENYEHAVAATQKEITVFLSKGITEEALLAKKGEMGGKYAVGLANTSGLASALHTIGIEGKPLAYIDEYPSLLNAVTLAEIKNAAKLVPWDKFSIAAAGTFL